MYLNEITIIINDSIRQVWLTIYFPNLSFLALPREFRTESPASLDNIFTPSARNKHCSTIAEENLSEFTLDHPESDGLNTEKLKSPPVEMALDKITAEFEKGLDKSTGLNKVDIPSLIRQKSTDTQAGVSKYEVHYGMLLKRSSQLWREIQIEQKENGAVDERKLAALDLVL